MLRYSKYAALILMLVIVFVSGCSDRGTNIPAQPEIGYITTPQDIKVSPAVHDFFPEMVFQIRNQLRLLEVAVYLPDVAFPEPYGPAQAVPLLILLPPQDGDQFYYFNHGLQQLADEMIADGTIQPMAICCLSNDKVFGGYFYAGHYPPAGDYDAVIGDALIEYLNSRFPLMNTPAKRGVGGTGQGAYGAFRAAMLHSDMFSSISVTDGPLDFDGLDGKSGLMELFDDALTEQSLDASNFKSFDTSGAWHISRMFVGGSYAFSPHDTLVYWHSAIVSNPDDFTESLDIFIDSTKQINDTTTLIRNIVNQSPDFDFHLPFDGHGNTYTPIWSMWLNNNLENVLANQGSASLASMDIQIHTTPDARYGFYDQTKSWINTMKNPPYSYNVKVSDYSGYEGNPATHDQYLYEIMRDMLKFHSDNFGD